MVSCNVSCLTLIRSVYLTGNKDIIICHDTFPRDYAVRQDGKCLRLLNLGNNVVEYTTMNVMYYKLQNASKYYSSLNLYLYYGVFFLRRAVPIISIAQGLNLKALVCIAIYGLYELIMNKITRESGIYICRSTIYVTPLGAFVA